MSALEHVTSWQLLIVMDAIDTFRAGRSKADCPYYGEEAEIWKEAFQAMEDGNSERSAGLTGAVGRQPEDLGLAAA